MHLHRLSAAILATALWLPPGAAARADVVTDWNKRAVAAAQASGQPLPAQARGLTMVHLAMFEALNAIEPRFAPYRSRLAVEPGASTAAAVLQALFGDALPAVRLAGGDAPAALREYHRLSDYVAEVVNARVYHGVQFRGAAEAGAAMGRKVGAFVARNQLHPAHAGL